jgi:hypothetical protein
VISATWQLANVSTCQRTTQRPVAQRRCASMSALEVLLVGFACFQLHAQGRVRRPIRGERAAVSERGVHVVGVSPAFPIGCLEEMECVDDIRIEPVTLEVHSSSVVASVGR